MDIENAQPPGVSGGDEIRCDGPDLNHFRSHYFTRMVWQATDTGSRTDVILQAVKRATRWLRAHGRGEPPDVDWVKRCFDAEFYLRHNPDVAQSGMEPWDHFDGHGRHEGRDPAPQFSVTWYLEPEPRRCGRRRQPIHPLHTARLERGSRPLR